MPYTNDDAYTEGWNDAMKEMEENPADKEGPIVEHYRGVMTEIEKLEKPGYFDSTPDEVVDYIKKLKKDCNEAYRKGLYSNNETVVRYINNKKTLTCDLQTTKKENEKLKRQMDKLKAEIAKIPDLLEAERYEERECNERDWEDKEEEEIDELKEEIALRLEENEKLLRQYIDGQKEIALLKEENEKLKKKATECEEKEIKELKDKLSNITSILTKPSKIGYVEKIRNVLKIIGDEEEEDEEVEVRAFCSVCDWEGKCLVSKKRAEELKILNENEDIGENDFCGCNQEDEDEDE